MKQFIRLIWAFLLTNAAQGQNSWEIHLGSVNSWMNYSPLKSRDISNTGSAFTKSPGFLAGFSVASTSSRKSETRMELIFRHQPYQYEYSRQYTPPITYSKIYEGTYVQDFISFGLTRRQFIGHKKLFFVSLGGNVNTILTSRPRKNRIICYDTYVNKYGFPLYTETNMLLGLNGGIGIKQISNNLHSIGIELRVNPVFYIYPDRGNKLKLTESWISFMLNYRMSASEKVKKDSVAKQVHHKTSCYLLTGAAASIVKETRLIDGNVDDDLYVNSQVNRGIEFALRLNQNISKCFSLAFDLCYNSRKMKYNIYYKGAPLSSSVDFDVNASYLGFAILPQMEFGKKTKFFIHAGPQAGSHLSVRGNQVTTRYNGLGDKTQSEGKYRGLLNFPVPVFELGLCAGMGVRDLQIGKRYYVFGIRAIPLIHINNTPGLPFLLQWSDNHVNIYTASVYFGMRI